MLQQLKKNKTDCNSNSWLQQSTFLPQGHLNPINKWVCFWKMLISPVIKGILGNQPSSLDQDLHYICWSQNNVCNLMLPFNHHVGLLTKVKGFPQIKGKQKHVIVLESTAFAFKITDLLFSSMTLNSVFNSLPLSFMFFHMFSSPTKRAFLSVSNNKGQLIVYFEAILMSFYGAY